MLAEQLTIPEGMVKGPERVLPRNAVFNGVGNSSSIHNQWRILSGKQGQIYFSFLDSQGGI
jgi:hypothetical protein